MDYRTCNCVVMSSLVQVADSILRKYGKDYKNNDEAMRLLEEAGAKYSSASGLLAAFKNPNEKDCLQDVYL